MIYWETSLLKVVWQNSILPLYIIVYRVLSGATPARLAHFCKKYLLDFSAILFLYSFCVHTRYCRLIARPECICNFKTEYFGEASLVITCSSTWRSKRFFGVIKRGRRKKMKLSLRSSVTSGRAHIEDSWIESADGYWSRVSYPTIPQCSTHWSLLSITTVMQQECLMVIIPTTKQAWKKSWISNEVAIGVASYDEVPFWEQKSIP